MFCMYVYIDMCCQYYVYQGIKHELIFHSLFNELQKNSHYWASLSKPHTNEKHSIIDHAQKIATNLGNLSVL